MRRPLLAFLLVFLPLLPIPASAQKPAKKKDNTSSAAKSARPDLHTPYRYGGISTHAGQNMFTSTAAAQEHHNGQPPRDTRPIKADSLTAVGISNGQLVPMYTLDPVEVHGRERTPEERRAYYKLVYNVRRTYPYAVLAKERMDRYNSMRESVPRKKEERKYLKEQEKEIKDDFTEDLKNMTKSQGAILIKLLARQTDTTAYYLLKDFRGGAKAFAYQTMARFWGYDLKEGYDPHGEDRDIETIVQMIEQGRLSTIPPKKTPALERHTKKGKKKNKNPEH